MYYLCMSVYFTPHRLLGGYFSPALTQYISSATSKSGRCHFLQFIDGGSRGPENKAQAFEFLHCFLALLFSFSQTVTNAQASAASSQESLLLHHVYLHGKQIIRHLSLFRKLFYRLQVALQGRIAFDKAGQVHDSWISWLCYSHYSSSCLLSYYPPTPPLKHSSPAQTLHPPSPFPFHFGVLKWHQVGTPVSSSGTRTYAKAAHTAGHWKLNKDFSVLTLPLFPALLPSLAHQIIEKETLCFCPKVLVTFPVPLGSNRDPAGWHWDQAILWMHILLG